MHVETRDAHSVINALHSSVMLVPTVPLLILNFLDRELALSQTFVAFGVPHLPARWPTAARFAEVCAEYPLHPLHQREALGAIALKPRLEIDVVIMII